LVERNALLSHAIRQPVMLIETNPSEATPQTDEMYSGCRDRDRITGLSGPG
jgi:hypothetical protein